jgi:hypothetical protein
MSSQDVALANVIAKQIGKRAMVMIGAKSLVAIENGLRIRHSCRGSKTNIIEITLNGLDLYDMRFRKTHGAKIREIGEENDVYCDQLCDMIEKYSGLYTHL